MISLNLRDGLIYVDATLAHRNSSVTIKNALVDTGLAILYAINEW